MFICSKQLHLLLLLPYNTITTAVTTTSSPSYCIHMVQTSLPSCFSFLTFFLFHALAILTFGLYQISQDRAYLRTFYLLFGLSRKLFLLLRLHHYIFSFLFLKILSPPAHPLPLATPNLFTLLLSFYVYFLGSTYKRDHMVLVFF